MSRTLIRARARTSLPVTFALLASALLLSGCAGKRAQPEAQAPASVPPPAADTVATVTPAGEAPRADLSQEERAAREALERRGMVIHFDFDSSQVRPEYFDLIAAHAQFANRFGQVTVRLEGHTDERGTREYNIGLGERRAQAVRRALELQGVPLSRISTVSYGEERPAAAGSGEDSWSRNRRVEIRYQP